MMTSACLSRVGLNRPELRAWAMYDWANSRVSVDRHHRRVPAVLQQTTRPPGSSPAEATARFAWATTIAVPSSRCWARCSARSPTIGALKKRLLARVHGDRRRRRRCCMATIDRGGWPYALAALHRRQHRRSRRQPRVLRFAAAAHRVAPTRSTACRRPATRSGYIGGGVLLLVEPRLDSEPADVRPAGHRGRDQAVVRQRRHLVAACFRFRCSDACRSRRRSGRRRDRAGERWFAPRSARAWDTFHELRGYRQRVPDAGRVPALQRRHPDDHPDGVDLRERRSASTGTRRSRRS